MNDPFATAPDEPQTAPAGGHDLPGVNDQISSAINSAPQIVATPVAVPSDIEIVTTFKAGPSFEKPWVVVHAPSVAESDALLDQAFADYLEKVKKVASFFNGGGSAPASNDAPQRQLQPGQPAGSVEAPSWAPPKPYDDFVYMTKVSPKTGKPWHAWMPPEKGDTREPKFFYPPR